MTLENEMSECRLFYLPIIARTHFDIQAQIQK